ncbi:MAG: N-6 DNA methylase [Bacteroidales bacterium]|nr:N-6 DNA methylase [Bacteroidales bacterium]
MFEQTFKNIDDILHKDAGCGSELDYVEQTSWILFLKYLDDLEKDKQTATELSGKTYTKIIEPKYQWPSWAAPKLDNGKIDHNAMTGDDLVDFVNGELFPYLKKFKTNAENANTIEYKIGEIFSELKNRIQSGYNLREVVNYIDELRFRTHKEKHEMSHLYEGKIKNMDNAGRNGGEYYTPRPLIKTIAKVVAPEIGKTIYNGAVGSAGFLVEAFGYLAKSKKLSTDDTETLQKNTFYGKEKKSLAYIIGIMNMILHGVEAPNIIHTNTLAENLADIQEKDRYNIILANPPFGGKERAEVQQNFPIKTGETASLFLQHFIKILKAGGKAGVVIKNTFLSNTDNASIALRKELLSSCNLHTVLDLPGGTFTGAGVKTVVLFFEKGRLTKKTWFYQLNLDRNLGKTNPLNEKDLAEFVELQKTQAESENSWTVNIADIDHLTFDLSVKNPNKKDYSIIREPKEIQADIKEIEKTSHLLFNNIDSSLKSIFNNISAEFPLTRIGDVCKVIAGQSPQGKYYNKESIGLPYSIKGKRNLITNLLVTLRLGQQKSQKRQLKMIF